MGIRETRKRKVHRKIIKTDGCFIIKRWKERYGFQNCYNFLPVTFITISPHGTSISTLEHAV